MLMGIVILQKRYALRDYVAAGMFCAGLVVFTLADRALEPSFDFVGIALISGGVLENFEKKFEL